MRFRSAIRGVTDGYVTRMGRDRRRRRVALQEEARLRLRILRRQEELETDEEEDSGDEAEVEDSGDDVEEAEDSDDRIPPVLSIARPPPSPTSIALPTTTTTATPEAATTSTTPPPPPPTTLSSTTAIVSTTSIAPPPPPPSPPTTLKSTVVVVSTTSIAPPPPSTSTLRSTTVVVSTSDLPPPVINAPANFNTIPPALSESTRSSASAAEPPTVFITQSIILSASTPSQLVPQPGTPLPESAPLSESTPLPESTLLTQSTSLPGTETTAAASPTQTGKTLTNNTVNDSPSSSDRADSDESVGVSKVGVAMGSVAGAALVVCIIFIIYQWSRRRNRSNDGQISRHSNNSQAAIGGHQLRTPSFAPQIARAPPVKSQPKAIDDMLMAAYAAEQGGGGVYYLGTQWQVGHHDFVDEKSTSLYSSYESASTIHELSADEPLPRAPVAQAWNPYLSGASSQSSMTQSHFPSQPPPVWNGVTNSNGAPRSPPIAAHTLYAERTTRDELLSLYARSSSSTLSSFYDLPIKTHREPEMAEQRHAERRQHDFAQLEAEIVQMERQISLQQAQHNVAIFDKSGLVPDDEVSVGPFWRPTSVARTEGTAAGETTIRSDSTWKTLQGDEREPIQKKSWLERCIELGGLR